MKIIVRKQTALLYATLFAAVFNDVLRISGTDISLFRILMIVTWIQCFAKRSNKLGKCLLVFFVFVVINGIQTLYFTSLDGFQNSVTIQRFLSYVYFAFCIFSVIFFTFEIFRYRKKYFIKEFCRFVVVCSYIILGLFIYIAISKHILGRNVSLFVSNVNNYGMYLNLVIPLFLDRFFSGQKKSSIITLSLMVIGMVVNDCKINLIAAVIMLVVFLILKRKDASQTISRTVIGFIIFFSVVIFVAYFTSGNLILNGHGFEELIGTPIKRIITGSLYSTSLTSIRYRVNVIIVGIPWLLKTHLIGIGFGNANILMRSALGGYIMKEKLYDYQSISLHNAPLELLLDFGIISLVCYIIGIAYTIKIVKKKQLTAFQIVFCSTVLSLPVWILSPAGITTTYFLFITMVFMYLSSREIET